MAEDGVTISINTLQYESAIHRLRAGVRAGFVDPQYGTLPVQARMLAERCQAFTPPRNVGQGNAAVARDLTRVYFPQSQSAFSNKSLRKIIRTDNRTAWNAAALNFGDSHGLKNAKAVGFSESTHLALKGSRGRVGKPRGGSKYGNFGMVTLGSEAKAARDYIKRVKERVGWARAGWNQGILAFGGHVAAGWVARHSVTRGRVIDGRADADPFVRVDNDTGWAKYNGSEGERIIHNAILARSRDMEAYYYKMMEVAAEKAAKGAAA